MQAVPPFDTQGFVAEHLVARGAPDVGGDVELVGQHLLGVEGGEHARAAGEDLGPVLGVPGSRPEPVEATHNSVLNPVGHGRHRVRLVVEREVVEAVLGFSAVHALDAVSDDDRHLVGERRVVRATGRVGASVMMALAIAVLEALTGERGTPGGGAEEEAASPLVSEAPDQVADTLETEHRVEDEEGDHRLAPRRVGGAGGGEAGHRTGFGDPLLEEPSAS